MVYDRGCFLDRELSKALKKLRLAKGLTQLEIADLTYYSRAMINKIESGIRPIRKEYVKAYAQVLGIHPSDIYKLAYGTRKS